MIIKMRRSATKQEIDAVETRLRELNYALGKLVGTDHTLIGVYGDVTQVPRGDISDMAGVDEIISVSRAYKRAAQKGDAAYPFLY